MKNAAASRNMSRFAAAKLDWWEAQYFTDGSKRRARREAKKQMARAVRRAAKAAIAEEV